MPRILEPGQIETGAQRTAPSLRLPERGTLFAARAGRLRQLAQAGAVGESIGDYLHLMAVVADAQHAALAVLEAPPPDAQRLALSATHRMPVIHANGWPRAPGWRDLVGHLGRAVCAAREAPAPSRAACERLQAAQPGELEAKADALLSGRAEAIDLAAAPFLMAALQVYWAALASRLSSEQVPQLEVRGVCPACGTLPVASIVRADQRSEGYRYLHCALCSTEWHLVRITCSHCQSTANIHYHSIEGDSGAIRAESCDQCHTYRKILYQEKDTNVDPVGDDLASLALDLLMSEAGYHRASGNPLLWQKT